MKIVSLNAWGGKQIKNLLEFIKSEAETTDVFCFQEISSCKESQVLPSGAVSNLIEQISDLLPLHSAKFFSSLSGFDFNGGKVNSLHSSGHAFFYKNTIGKTNGFEKLPSWDGRAHMSGFISFMEFEKISIVNVHGAWTGGGKGDNEVRLKQSELILNIAEKLPGKKIIIGDFNLNPETKSLDIIKQLYEELVIKYKIRTTRSNLYTKKEEMPFADYCFVSKDIKVKNFSVPYLEASDHLPLILEIE